MDGDRPARLTLGVISASGEERPAAAPTARILRATASRLLSPADSAAARNGCPSQAEESAPPIRPRSSLRSDREVTEALLRSVGCQSDEIALLLDEAER